MLTTMLLMGMLGGQVVRDHANYAAPVDPRPARMDAPVDARPVRAEDLALPASDSVRAATWDRLQAKPAEPRRVALACIVIVEAGAPGACIPASLLPAGQKQVDWAKLRAQSDAADRAATAEELAIRQVASERIAASRLRPAPARDGKTAWAVRVFEETVSPTDARPAFAPGETLAMSALVQSRPLDGELILSLYPVTAMRHAVTARVSVACRIEPSLTLLCRDPGTIKASPADVGADTAALNRELLFATYQMASTIRLAPKAKDGSDVAGKTVTVAITWKMPEDAKVAQR